MLMDYCLNSFFYAPVVLSHKGERHVGAAFKRSDKCLHRVDLSFFAGHGCYLYEIKFPYFFLSLQKWNGIDVDSESLDCYLVCGTAPRLQQPSAIIAFTQE